MEWTCFCLWLVPATELWIYILISCNCPLKPRW
jgi:hypothetical protein